MPQTSSGTSIKPECRSGDWRSNATKYLLEFFETHPCVDCGERDPRGPRVDICANIVSRTYASAAVSQLAEHSRRDG